MLSDRSAFGCTRKRAGNLVPLLFSDVSCAPGAQLRVSRYRTVAVPWDFSALGSLCRWLLAEGAYNAFMANGLTYTRTSVSPDATKQLAATLAPLLRAGDVILLSGDLGAGKAAFTRGLAAGLGVTEPVTSPTYTIVNEYLGGRLPLFHFDMYRLSSADDLFDIGWEDYLDRGGVCAVEWSENVTEAMEGAVSVTIDVLGENTRRITISGGDFLADLSL